jgi:DNA-binding MarR family transcriptional regulator
VRDVARLAADRDDDPLKDPAKVTMVAFDRARHALESKWGPISRASEICRHLSDDDAKPYPWSDLLAVACDDSVDFVQHHAQRRSRPDRALSDDVVFWAVNQVALRLKVRTLRPDEYDAGREMVLRDAGISARSRLALERVLPTANQLANYCKGWDRVLEVARLQPRLLAPSGKKKYVRPYTRRQILEAVWEFKLSLRAGEAPSSGRYKRFASGRDIPKLKAINAHGGLRALMAELARTPDWRDRAIRADRAKQAALLAAEKIADESQMVPPSRKPRRLNPERRVKFLEALCANGRLPSRELVDELGIGRMTVCNLGNELEKRGLVKRTESNPTSPRQHYELTEMGRAALKDRSSLNEQLASRPREETANATDSPAVSSGVKAEEEDDVLVVRRANNIRGASVTQRGERWSVDPGSKGPAYVAGVSLRVGLHTRHFAALNLRGSPADPKSVLFRLFHHAADIARERGKHVIWFEHLSAAAAEIESDDPDIAAVREATGRWE